MRADDPSTCRQWEKAVACKVYPALSRPLQTHSAFVGVSFCLRARGRNIIGLYGPLS